MTTMYFACRCIGMYNIYIWHLQQNYSTAKIVLAILYIDQSFSIVYLSAESFYLMSTLQVRAPGPHTPLCVGSTLRSADCGSSQWNYILSVTRSSGLLPSAAGYTPA